MPSDLEGNVFWILNFRKWSHVKEFIFLCTGLRLIKKFLLLLQFRCITDARQYHKDGTHCHMVLHHIAKYQEKILILISKMAGEHCSYFTTGMHVKFAIN